VQSSRAQVERDPRGEAGRDTGAATPVVATAWVRRALESRRVREWMAWRRYLIATRMSNGLAAYPSREEDAWARVLEDLPEVDSSGSLQS
jgi:hypothetical protein